MSRTMLGAVNGSSDGNDQTFALTPRPFRHLGNGALYAVLGGLAILFTGTIAQVIGVGFVVVACLYFYRAAVAFGTPSGALRITPDQVEIPRISRHSPTPTEPSTDVGATSATTPVMFDTVAPGTVTAAFILRRHLPWLRQGPLLVVETATKRWQLPSEWFDNEGQQELALAALHRHGHRQGVNSSHNDSTSNRGV